MLMRVSLELQINAEFSSLIALWTAIMYCNKNNNLYSFSKFEFKKKVTNNMYD